MLGFNDTSTLEVFMENICYELACECSWLRLSEGFLYIDRVCNLPG